MTRNQAHPTSQVPHRKQVRTLVAGFRSEPGHFRSLVMFLFDYVIWITGLALVCLPTGWEAKLPGSLMLFIASARLFILGHDACHGSFSSSLNVNKIIGHLALLPTLTPRQSWVAGHNIAHHGYNNLRGYDYVWTPLSPAEYAALSAFGRLKYRIYRSGWAPGLYYLTEIWWKKLFFPTRAEIGSAKPEFFRHSLYVSAFLASWLAILVVSALLTDQKPLVLLTLGFAVPFLAWNTLIGFVVYVHHTNPHVKWYSTKAEWAAKQAYLTSTVHMVFSLPFNWLLHNIMEHTAHHVDLAVPFYRLKSAQAALVTALPEKVLRQPFSWCWYFSTANSCQLYDYSNHRWIGSIEVSTLHA